MAETEVPPDLRYTETDEWLRLADDEGVVGITAYAVHQLGDLAFLDLPAAGRQLARGEVFGEIESTKAVSQLFAPVSGEIIAVNSPLADDLKSLERSPYHDGWMIRIRLTNPAEVAELLTPEAYAKHCAAREH